MLYDLISIKPKRSFRVKSAILAGFVACQVVKGIKTLSPRDNMTFEFDRLAFGRVVGQIV